MVRFVDNVFDAAQETRMRALVEKAASTSKLERDEILTLLRGNTGQAESLFAAADQVRRRTVGDVIHLRGLIEFSNFCRRNCLYCGIRAENDRLERYRIPSDEILRICEQMQSFGVNTVLLQSGEDPKYECDVLCGLIERIRERLGLTITLSVGERPPEEYKAFKEAGACSFLLKHLTADSSLYGKLHPGMSFFERLNCLYELKKIGYEVGGGSMVGLPGQTLHSLADDLILLRSLGTDLAAIGPFIPAHDTPLGFEVDARKLRTTPVLSVSSKKETVAEFVLKLLALTRLLLPEVHLVSNTALASLLPNGREMGLRAGANVLLPNFTPTRCKELFWVFDDRICTRESPEEAISSIRRLADKLGRHIV
jgi:biotin synthase